MIELAQIFGWVGSVAYAVAAIPQVVMCIRNGHARGFSRGFAYLCLTGAILSCIYAFPERDYILLLNFSFGIVLNLIILKYSYFERISV